MVTVEFLRSGDKPLRTLGPFPWVRLHDGSLRAGPDDKEVAHHRGGVWYAGEVSAPKYAIHGSACALRFEGEGPAESASLGSLDKVEVLDGAVYTQPGGRLVARLDEAKHAWYAYEDKRFWPSLVVEHCAGPDGP